MSNVRIGDTIDGTLHLKRLVSRGELGEVFEARCDQRSATVAVKVFHPHLVDSGADFTEYQISQEMICGTEQNHVVQVLEFGELEDDSPYMVTQWIPGENLDARIRRRRRMPPAEVTQLLVQTAAALNHLRQHGAVHGDLKPGHLMLQDASAEVLHVKLLDVGVAGLLATASGGPARKVHPFMAPETVEGLAVGTGPVDVYGMGALAAFALTGIPPYGGKASELADSIRQQEPTVVEADSDPTEVSRVISRAMSREPANRYQLPDELVEAFREAVKSAPTSRPRVAVKPDQSLRENPIPRGGHTRKPSPTGPSRRVAAHTPAPRKERPSPASPAIVPAAGVPAPAPALPTDARPGAAPPSPIAPVGEDLLGGKTLMDAGPSLVREPEPAQDSATTPDQDTPATGALTDGADLPVGHTVLADDDLAAELVAAEGRQVERAVEEPAAEEPVPAVSTTEERHTVMLPDAGALEPGPGDTERRTIVAHAQASAVEQGDDPLSGDTVLTTGAAADPGSAPCPRQTMIAPDVTGEQVAAPPAPAPAVREPAPGMDHVTVLADGVLEEEKKGDAQIPAAMARTALSIPAREPVEPEQPVGLPLVAIVAMAAGAATLAIVLYLLLL